MLIMRISLLLRVHCPMGDEEAMSVVQFGEWVQGDGTDVAEGLRLMPG